MNNPFLDFFNDMSSKEKQNRIVMVTKTELDDSFENGINLNTMVVYFYDQYSTGLFMINGESCGEARLYSINPSSDNDETYFRDSKYEYSISFIEVRTAEMVAKDFSDSPLIKNKEE